MTTEEYKFAVVGNMPYANGGDPTWVKLWVDGQLIINWTTGMLRVPTWIWEVADGYLELRAGEKYDVVLQCGFNGTASAVHLCWDTPSRDQRHIQQMYLYPTNTSGALYGGGVQAYWKCDDGSGTTAADASGNNNTATLSNATWTANGVVHGALQFNGTNSVVTCPLLVSATAYTTALWFNTLTANGGLFSVTDNGSGHDRDLYLSNGNLYATVSNGSMETIGTTGTNYADGCWHHLVHVLGGPDGEQRLYVDGALVAIGTVCASTFTTQTGIKLGYSAQAGTPYFTGSIDQVHIYNCALNARAVLDTLYRQEVGLIAYLPCDENSGLFAQSVVGAGIYGTLTGNSAWASGKYGSGIAFNSGGVFTPASMPVEQEVRLPDTNYTLSCWFNTTSANGRLLRAHRFSGYNNMWEDNILALSNGNLTASIAGDNGLAPSTSTMTATGTRSSPPSEARRAPGSCMSMASCRQPAR